VTLQVKPGTTWDEVYARARAAAPEAFDTDRILNLHGGEWQRSGVPGEHVTPVDGTPVQGPPRVTHDEASAAVVHAHREHDAWTRVDLDERKARVQTAVDGLAEVRDTLALLLAWEIGKPWKLACADVDRALDGVRWYLGEIDRQLQGRSPLPGPVSNIASWNYPMSVQVHAELVQCLAGNGVVAKTPSQGGFHTLTLAHAVMRRAGCP
jgi:acyl-CoA reductase-like NAD-dependent aldehyde dehydrogenase